MGGQSQSPYFVRKLNAPGDWNNPSLSEGDRLKGLFEFPKCGAFSLYRVDTHEAAEAAVVAIRGKPGEAHYLLIPEGELVCCGVSVVVDAKGATKCEGARLVHAAASGSREALLTLIDVLRADSAVKRKLTDGRSKAVASEMRSRGCTLFGEGDCSPCFFPSTTNV